MGGKLSGMSLGMRSHSVNVQIRDRCDTIQEMKTTLSRLRDNLGADTDYFQKVYNYTFEFSRPAGQRSLGLSPPLRPPI